MPALDKSPNILEVLDGVTFPATAIELVAYAQDHDASEDVLDLIQAMPDRDYVSIHDVNRSLGLIGAQEGDENTWSSAPSDEFLLPAEPMTALADATKQI
jgi:hypothetical protein